LRLISRQRVKVDLKREDMMMKSKDYLLRQYGNRYRAAKDEDGIWNLETRHKPRHGTTYEVYDYSDDLLAACLPPQAARHVLKQHPGVFRVHQDADDGMVLVLEEKRLDELADALKLRRRKQVSEGERQRLAELSRQHSGAGLAKLAERRRHLSGSKQTA